jgi:SAM-dependent methyltransferase
MHYTTDPRRNANEDYYLERDYQSIVGPQIIDFLRPRLGRRVLDLGCGTGGYTHRLRALGFDVAAVDRNPKYIEIARSRGVNATVADGESLPFADESFDTVFCVEVLEHIPAEAIPGFLAEAHRVAKTNLLVTVPDCTQFPQLAGLDLMYAHFLTVDHVQFFTVQSLASLLRQFFPDVAVKEGDPLFPHRLLPPVVRKPISLLYRIGLLRPTLFSRLYAEARKHPGEEPTHGNGKKS